MSKKDWFKNTKWLRSITEKLMTEEEITKEHDAALKFIGQRLYQFALPLIEIHEALARVLGLNREMYQLKEKQKKEAAEKPKLEAAPEPKAP